MRFMFIIRSESDAHPTPEMIAEMHAMAEREVKAGRMIADGGLAPPAAGARMKVGKGKVTVLDGPFTETKEVIGGFAVFELPDLEVAKQSAREFLGLHARHMPDWEGTCEIRQVAGSQVEMIRASGG